MKTFDFQCGCKIPILDEAIKPEDGLPSMEIDFENLPEKCPDTWALFCNGKTKGIFQLEKSLGQTWSKRLQPVTIEEVGALVSLIRPGCLKSIVDGKTMTQHYQDRKNGDEEYTNFHPDAGSILDYTYGVITYQEQTLALAKMFAGYDLVAADLLRKAIGKKKADIMAQCRITFVKGCIEAGIISEGDAIALFDIIEKSNRYSFNKAHAIGYGKTSYQCAYAKAHFPLHFYCSYLANSGDKANRREEVRELISDSKSFKLDILSPSIFIGNENFVLEDGKIRFGIGNVKDIGGSKVTQTLIKIAEIEGSVGKRLKDMSWYEMLVNVLPELGSKVVNNLIAVGAFSNYGMSRSEMLYQYKKVCGSGPKTTHITDTELKWIKANKFNDIISAVKGLIAAKVPNKKRIISVESTLDLLEKPRENLSDSVQWASGVEEELLGTSITCSKLDGCDTSTINCKCGEFSDCSLRHIIMGLQIDRVTEWKPKVAGAKPLAFVTAHDETGSVEIMVPADQYSDNGFLLFVGNTVIFTGFKNKRNSLQVKGITQI
jgi:DNA polymerase III subunit alpha